MIICADLTAVGGSVGALISVYRWAQVADLRHVEENSLEMRPEALNDST
jgi:hypothetical protein